MCEVTQPTLPADRRATEIRHLDAVYEMPVYRTREDWEARAQALREQILVATGLWPMPERTPLNSRIFGRVEREGYTVEKVYLETLPGFFLCGNLFRPPKRRRPVPGILHPHGHTPLQIGRLDHAEAVGSTLARLGCVMFAYDMVGFVDTNQIPHTYGGRREALWGLSLMGLQLWNSIRATDFLASLPDVDPARIGCAGASGGGTQTFMLTALDPRIAACVPVVMVSSLMQGGCLCENAPGLRLDTNNMEIAALAAPRPQLLVAATGDWTRLTPEVEYPAIRSIYRLFGAEDRLAYRIFDGPHGYERPAREAVCAWFARWFLGIEDPERCREGTYPRDRPLDLLVWYGLAPPKRRLHEQALTKNLIRSAKKRLAALRPRDEAGLRRLRSTLGVALRRALAAEYPAPEAVTAQPRETVAIAAGTARFLTLAREGRGDAVPALLLQPTGEPKEKADAANLAVLLVHARGKAAVADPLSGRLSPLARACLRRGAPVLTLDCFGTGESPLPSPDPRLRFLDTYNRTLTANCVQDLLTGLAYLRGLRPGAPVALVGSGLAGLWAILAAGLAAPETLIADVARLDPQDDDAFLRHLYVPSLRSAGDLEAACALAYPCRLFLHNTGGKFRALWAAGLYRELGKASRLRIVAHRASLTDLVDWIFRA